MKFYPPSAFVTGALYFRDSLTIESTETFSIDAETNHYDRFLKFQFEDFSVRYDYPDHKLEYYRIWDGVSEGSNNYSITLSYFFEQQIEIGPVRANLLSFIFDISIGDDYRIFKVHGYFSNDISKITIRNEMFLTPYL